MSLFGVEFERASNNGENQTPELQRYDDVASVIDWRWSAGSANLFFFLIKLCSTLHHAFRGARSRNQLLRTDMRQTHVQTMLLDVLSVTTTAVR